MNVQTLKPGNRNFGLDLVRSVAIVLVLIAHAGVGYCFGVKLGTLGVEIFFVLSGFLIGQILIKDFSEQVTFSKILHFWSRRWFRTLPLYYTVILIRFVFFDSSLGIKILVYFFFLQNNFVGIDFMPVSWSLVIEEWFYLIVPIMIYILFRKKIIKDKFTAFLILFILFENIARIVWVLYTNRGYAAIIGNFPFRLDSLMVGVLLANIKLNYNFLYLKLRNKYVYLLALILWLFLLYNVGKVNQIEGLKDDLLWTRTIWFCLISLTIALQIPFIENIKIKSSNIFARFIQLISISTYAMYLIHPYIYNLIIKTKTDYTQWSWQMPLALTVTFICGYLIYTFYEKPITDLRDRLKLK